ncbi:MAG TPA: CaiB/BaiF CoA-transferase family protein, partial [Acetobacteraceae bacterium]|nr:CaiB/BaiF CoA-transferase family protein [Acetobacteraceae bacterium]
GAPRPLDGILVVTLEHAIAAPFATRQLADLGARVIKVERPGAGDFARSYDDRVRGLASHFVWCNRSKESLTLDLKHAEAGEILSRLLAKADVLVQNLAPGAAARLGLSEEALRPTHPRLILCDISGYGEDGPYRDRKAYDLLIQSEAGFLSVTGTEDHPSKAGISIADIAAGMYAYSGILAALIERNATGRGSKVEIAMLEALGEWMSFPLYYAFEGQAPPPRTGAAHATIYPYGPFATADGRTVMLGLQNEREWKIFCEAVLRKPALAADPRFDSNGKRAANRELLAPIVTGIFAALTAEELVGLLDQAGIANAHVNDMPALWAHPQLAARRRWRKVGSPAGPVPALLPPANASTFAPRMDAVPALGEHSDVILGELGFSPAEIARLHREDAV